MATVIHKIVSEKQTPSEEDYPELQDKPLWKLLQRCWDYDPQDRPAMIKVCGNYLSLVWLSMDPTLPSIETARSHPMVALQDLPGALDSRSLEYSFQM
ncbi:hypothetical protein FRC00_000778 [Tulasnella sp. 408]|nr:hypothetical protein FRC00_000778 [Tulasnella sp. 408]